MINVKTFLKNNIDLNYCDFNKKLISTKYQILGIRLPELRKIAKQIEPENIELDNNISHEEILLYGFSASLKKNTKVQLDYLTKILPFIDNWCTCDCIIQSMKKLENEDAYILFMNLLKNENQYYVRVGIVGLMRYFIKSKYIDEILTAFKTIQNDGYFVKMALAWFYAEYCTINIEKAKKEIASIKDKFVRNKAISKARESFRVSKENKDFLSTLRL